MGSIILNIKTRQEWRNWLLKNFNSETEAWLVYAKKSSGEERIQYNDAVEEALCFGWIDSINKTIDENHNMQRFSQRNPGSKYSQANIERLRWLFENELVHQSIVDSVKGIINKEFIFPTDIINELKKDETAWRNYQKFTDSYKRIRIAYIEGARNRPNEFKRRLNNFIEKTRENKLMAGFGGINKYY